MRTICTKASVIRLSDLREIWEGARCMAARLLLGSALRILPACRVRSQLAEIQAAWNLRIQQEYERLADEDRKVLP